jgi:hypothetical protein
MKFTQSPQTLLMIRPACFGFNDQTAVSNVFQQHDPAMNTSVHHDAIKEFDRMVELLSAHEIDVRVFEDTNSVIKPDALFPNNWISFHENGTIILYSMMAENRRWEKRPDIIETLKENFVVRNVIDLSDKEVSGKFLEGTGSLVFDHTHQKVYACLSPRTNTDLVHYVAKELNYEPITFNALDEKGRPIYHTNVMMCIGERFVVICLDSIKDENDQDVLLASFASSGRKVVAISYAQLHAFAGNMFSVKTAHGDEVVLLSENALQVLLPGQLKAISEHAELLPVKIETIEKFGGGSVRCMVAGIHLPKK